MEREVKATRTGNIARVAAEVLGRSAVPGRVLNVVVILADTEAETVDVGAHVPTPQALREILENALARIVADDALVFDHRRYKPERDGS